jgi:hypothetical protein
LLRSSPPGGPLRPIFFFFQFSTCPGPHCPHPETMGNCGLPRRPSTLKNGPPERDCEAKETCYTAKET